LLPKTLKSYSLCIKMLDAANFTCSRELEACVVVPFSLRAVPSAVGPEFTMLKVSMLRRKVPFLLTDSMRVHLS